MGGGQYVFCKTLVAYFLLSARTSYHSRGQNMASLAHAQNPARPRVTSGLVTKKAAAKIPILDRSGKTTINISASKKQTALHKQTGRIGSKASVGIVVAKTKKKPGRDQKVTKAIGWGSEAPSTFKKFYDRGDLPVLIEHIGAKRSIAFRVDVKHLDYMYYLPIFFDGLKERREPYSYLALHGTLYLLKHGGNKILPCVRDIVLPFKAALDSCDADSIAACMQIFQALVVSSDYVGEALVPYFKMLLPTCNKYCESRRVVVIDAAGKKQPLGELIYDTLTLMERHCGPDAFINIKYMVPMFMKPVD